MNTPAILTAAANMNILQYPVKGAKSNINKAVINEVKVPGALGKYPVKKKAEKNPSKKLRLIPELHCLRNGIAGIIVRDININGNGNSL